MLLMTFKYEILNIEHQKKLTQNFLRMLLLIKKVYNLELLLKKYKKYYLMWLNKNLLGVTQLSQII